VIDFSSSPLRDRIFERTRLAGIDLTPEEAECIERYYLLLERWNLTINLTALPLATFPDRTIDRLLVEPLMAASYVDDSPVRWIDLGSGGGSPAIPLKIVRPSARLTMVESKERKAAFLREVVRSLELVSADVLTSRIETLAGAGLRETAHIVTVRAVKIDERLLDSAAALLTEGGQLMVFRSDIALSVNDMRFEVRNIDLRGLHAGLSLLTKVR
jgi:16S rRNA (guanine527-N7)-methyltransferase